MTRIEALTKAMVATGTTKNQEKFASLVGCRQSTVSMWLNRQRAIGDIYLAKICDLAGIDIEDVDSEVTESERTIIELRVEIRMLREQLSEQRECYAKLLDKIDNLERGNLRRNGDPAIGRTVPRQ